MIGAHVLLDRSGQVTAGSQVGGVVDGRFQGERVLVAVGRATGSPYVARVPGVADMQA